MTAVVYKPIGERFHVPVGSCVFKSQFAQIYTSRLASARPTLESLARNHWPGLPVRSLCDLAIDDECIIIGTLYKKMCLKPSVIKQLAEMEQNYSGDEKKVAPLFTEGIHRLTSEADDEIFLEDEVQRICLNCDVDDSRFLVGHLVTGVVVAVRGFESESSQGSFTVKDVTFLEPQPEHPVTPVTAPSSQFPSTMPPFSGPSLVFVSGLGFIGTGIEISGGHQLALQLLGDWLREGGSGLNIAHLIILGDSIRSSAASGEHGDAIGLVQQARFLTRKADADSVTAMAQFDAWLSQLPLGPGLTKEGGERNGISVEILPGPSDCAGHLLPQQPLHATMFPKAVARSGGVNSGGLRSSTNPSIAVVGSRKVLATSGQSISDILRYSTFPDSLKAIEMCIRWGHMAPTCPDTLYGYPLPDRDLLLFQTTPTKSEGGSVRALSPDYPDIFAVGNQKTYGCRRCGDDGALLVSVPRFDVSQTVVIVELTSLRCLPLRFHVADGFQEEEGHEAMDTTCTSDVIDSSVLGEET